MFIHGIKEIIVTITHCAIIILLIIVASIALASISTELIALISMVIIGLSLSSIVSIVYNSAILNMANQNGSLRAGFDLKKISKNIRRIGIIRLLFVYFGFMLAFSIVGIFISDYILPNIPLMGYLISQLVIAPYILISTTRFWGYWIDHEFDEIKISQSFFLLKISETAFITSLSSFSDAFLIFFMIS